jgi:hypothetical protein
VIYWRCTECEVVEATSPYVDALLHRHRTGKFESLWLVQLTAFKTHREAKGARRVKRKNRTGLKRKGRG